MKKFLVTLSALTLLLACLFCVSASAKRYEKIPVSLTQKEKSGSDTIFTITKLKVFEPFIDSQPISDDYTKLNKKTIYFDLYGYFGNDVNADGEIDFILYCYDKKGNHIDTHKFDVCGNDNYTYGWEYYFEVPDKTASFEITSENPGAWSNSLYVNKRVKVSSADGRTKSVPLLLLWSYEKVGWYRPAFSEFKATFDTYINAGDYENAIRTTNLYLMDYRNSAFAKELYSSRTKAMDKWHEKIKCPVAISEIKTYQSNGKNITKITFRNVSYKTVKSITLREKPKIPMMVITIPKKINENIHSLSTTSVSYIDMDTENFDIIIKEVTFDDGTTWKLK